MGGKAVVEVLHLSKRFGSVFALDDLSMTVYESDVYGFIGPNGAGKTTTFAIMATILKPDAGVVKINGVDIRQGASIRQIIGYMPDTFGVYEDMTVFQYLDFFGAAYYIPADRRKKLIADILSLTDLSFKSDAMVRSLSRGMQQRLGVARVLIHDPKVLILDEPASGLDPRARIELRELLKELAGMGKTILISSHILSELSEMCNRVGIVEQGRIVFEGSQAELGKLMIARCVVSIDTAPDDCDRAFLLLQAAPFTREAVKTHTGIALRVKDDLADISTIPAFLIANGCRIRKFVPEEMSLEDAFMALTKGNLA